MKKPRLQDFLFWRGQPAQVIGLCDLPQVTIQMLENEKCPHCGADLGPKQFEVVIQSPLFQENAEPVKTIEL